MELHIRATSEMSACLFWCMSFVRALRGVGFRRSGSVWGLKVVKSCSYGALPIHFFIRFCCMMYRLATVYSVTDWRTWGPTPQQITAQCHSATRHKWTHTPQVLFLFQVFKNPESTRRVQTVARAGAKSVILINFSYRIYVSRSLIIEIMTVALTRSSYEETFRFSAGQRIVRVPENPVMLS